MAITGYVNLSYYVPNPTGQGELSGQFQLVNPAAVGEQTPVALTSAAQSITIPTNATGGTPLFALIFPISMVNSGSLVVANTQPLLVGGATATTLHPNNPSLIPLPATTPTLELGYFAGSSGVTQVNAAIVWI